MLAQSISPHGRGARLGATLVAACVLGAGGCIVEDRKCSENQRENNASFLSCECLPGFVPSPRGYGCDPCGANEVAAGNTCECIPGYARARPGAPCEMVEGSPPGTPCSESMPCAGVNNHCAVNEPEPFCTTTGCTRAEDCPLDWRCNTKSSPSYCTKPPTGIGTPCEVSSECAGFEASYCETLVAHACIVNDCASDPLLCPNGQICCDLTFLAGTSLCVLNSFLTDGLCPGDTPPVRP